MLTATVERILGIDLGEYKSLACADYAPTGVVASAATLRQVMVIDYLLPRTNEFESTAVRRHGRGFPISESL